MFVRFFFISSLKKNNTTTGGRLLHNQTLHLLLHQLCGKNIGNTFQHASTAPSLTSSSRVIIKTPADHKFEDKLKGFICIWLYWILTTFSYSFVLYGLNATQTFPELSFADLNVNTEPVFYFIRECWCYRNVLTDWVQDFHTHTHTHLKNLKHSIHSLSFKK